MSITFMVFRQDRAQVTDVSIPVCDDFYTLFVRSSSSYELNTFEMVHVFKSDVWIALAIVSVLAINGFWVLLENPSKKGALCKTNDAS